MKDAYSFHSDEASLDATIKICIKHIVAYSNVGINARPADSGAIGEVIHTSLWH